MKYIILFFILSTTSSAQVPKVATGQIIQADQINKIIDELVPIGTIYESLLTPAQFLSVNGNCWKLMNGESLANTDLNSVTGMTNLPNATTNGEFLRQAISGRALGSSQTDAIRNITARTNFASDINGTMGVGPGTDVSGAFWGNGSPTVRIGDSDGGRAGSQYLNFDASRSPGVLVASENRPVNIAVNFFVKVNKACTLP